MFKKVTRDKPDEPVVEPAVTPELPAELAPVQAVVSPAPQPEPFKMRAGVNCVVDGGQVKPL